MDELEVEGVGTERDRQQGQQTRGEEEEEEGSEWQRADEERPRAKAALVDPTWGFPRERVSEPP
jgi:hypothetical protein